MSNVCVSVQEWRLQARVLAGGNYSGLSVGEAAPVTSLRTDLRDSTGTLSVTSDCVHQGLGKGSLVASRRTKLVGEKESVAGVQW